MKLKVSIRQLVAASAVHLGAKAEIVKFSNMAGADAAKAMDAEVEFETDDITKVLRFIRKAEKE